LSFFCLHFLHWSLSSFICFINFTLCVFKPYKIYSQQTLNTSHQQVILSVQRYVFCLKVICKIITLLLMK
jgi:hypothetical protein